MGANCSLDLFLIYNKRVHTTNEFTPKEDTLRELYPF